MLTGSCVGPPAQDKHDRFIADQMVWSEFVEEDHKKYEADTYFKVCGPSAASTLAWGPHGTDCRIIREAGGGIALHCHWGGYPCVKLNSHLPIVQIGKTEPMSEPERGQFGKQAYWDFIKGLKSIQQLEVRADTAASVFLVLWKGAFCVDLDLTSVHFQPLSPEHTGASVKPSSGEDGKLVKDSNKQRARKAQWERLISDRAAAETTYRFQERMKYRAEYFNDTGDGKEPLRKPGILR